MAHTIELDSETLTKIVDYLTWMEMMPQSIKDSISMDEVNWSVFGEFGYEAILIDAIDDDQALDLDLDISISDYMMRTRIEIDVNSNSRYVVVEVDEVDEEEKIIFKFVPSSLTE